MLVGAFAYSPGPRPNFFGLKTLVKSAVTVNVQYGNMGHLWKVGWTCTKWPPLIYDHQMDSQALGTRMRVRFILRGARSALDSRQCLISVWSAPWESGRFAFGAEQEARSFPSTCVTVQILEIDTFPCRYTEG